MAFCGEWRVWPKSEHPPAGCVGQAGGRLHRRVGTGREDFFAGIEHREVLWGERVIRVPVFYRDVMSLGALFLAPSERL